MFKSDIPFDTIKEKYTDEQSKFISIDGMDVHYKDEGEGEVLLLLHSVNTSLQDWDSCSNDLKKYFRVVRLDLPGFGLTMANKEFDYKRDSYIYFLKKFTIRVGIDTFHFGGASMGADLAWHFSLLSPYLIKSLVLVNPTDYPNYHPSAQQKMSRHWLGKHIVRWSGSKKMIQKRVSKWFGESMQLTETAFERYHNLILREGNRSSFISLNNAFHRDRFNRLGKLKNPTLILWSEEIGENPFAKVLPHAKTIYYKNTHLYPMVESPIQTSKDLLSFLQNHKHLIIN